MTFDALKVTAIVFVAVVLQSSIVSTIEIRGGTPDLVLVTLVAIALLRGAIWGAAAGFAAGLLLAGTAGAMWLFILGRAVQGLGGGLVIVALYVIVGRAYPERLRPAIMAAFGVKWISATSGTLMPWRVSAALMSFRFSASRIDGAVTRTISQ